MGVVFNAIDHSYKNQNSEDSIVWTSVTTLISKFKMPFEQQKIAKSVSKKKTSKWYGMKPADIIKVWENEALRATTVGTYYHDQRENDVCSFASMDIEGITIPVIKPLPEKNGLKFSPSQKLTDGVYPEHLVYLKSSGVCGQGDLIEVVNGHINIIDYKTNKKIDLESYRDWEGVSKKMLAPIGHLDDCNFNHYSLQLSIYMYIMLKHNPKLKVGKMFIHHIEFDTVGEDKYGYPINKFDHNGDPVINAVIPMEVPYLKDEVISLIKSLNS
jgi:hypothetical protein